MSYTIILVFLLRPTSINSSLLCTFYRLVSSDPVEDETGELKSKEDQEFRQNSELMKLRVTWNIERRCYIDAAGIKRWISIFLSRRYIVILRCINTIGTCE